MAIITLTTDLGLTDYYAGALKGFILKNCPSANIIDISHQVKPFDILQAAFIIKNSWKQFPKNTIHIIDMEAANIFSTRYLLVVFEDHYFLSRDHGIFSLIFGDKLEEVYEIAIKPDDDPSFHLARAGCKIGRGVSPAEIGKRANHIQGLNALQPVITENSIRAYVIYIDHYENIMVNVEKTTFEEVCNGRKFSINFRREFIDEMKTGYHEVVEGEKVAFFNSSGYLEIAINKGKAGSLLGLRMNDKIQIDFE